MAATYDFDVFISYSSANRPWAQRLFDDLIARGVPRQRIFFDDQRLDKGVPWEPQLAGKVVKARHFVVLWSAAAADSDWVREEMIRFKIEIDPNGSGPLSTDRRLFQLLLQKDVSSVLSRYHGFSSLADVDVAAGPGAMNASQAASWNAIITDLVEAVIPPVPGVPWPVAVFASTAATLPAAPPNAPPGFNGTFEQFLQQLDVPTYAAFTGQYKARPQDWQPFGSTMPISTMLDGLLAKVNQQLAKAPGKAGPPLRWQYVDLVTTAFQRVDDEVQKLSIGSCLLIVDPLTLLIPGMNFRYTKLSPCFENKAAVILWLTPFGPHQPFVLLRETVKDLAQPLIKGYYQPLPPGTPLGRCALNLSDEFELTRMVLSAVAEMPAPPGAVTGASVLNVGEKQP